MKSHYKSIESFFDPVDSLVDCCDNLYTEMTREQSGFLCGLLKKYKPHKIVEVGVAAGGTTAIILNCLNAISLQTEVFSVDLNEYLYYDHSKSTGYIAKEYISSNGSVAKHNLMTGQFLPETLDEIGGEIDFVILDTVHRLPGEILDYLSILPYLSDKAVVVLHDVALEHNNSMNYPYCYATQVLFSTVTAQKYLNNHEEYPNIAAFVVDADTRENVADVFSALTLTWDPYYFPSEKEKEIYSDFYLKHYDNELCRLFDQALHLNEKTLKNSSWIIEPYIESLKSSLMGCYRHIILYGKGKRGKCLYRALCESDSSVALPDIEFVVSDEEEARRSGCIAFEKMDYDRNDTLIVLAADSDQIRKTLSHSKWIWLDIPEPIWNSIEVIYKA